MSSLTDLEDIQSGMNRMSVSHQEETKEPKETKVSNCSTGMELVLFKSSIPRTQGFSCLPNLVWIPPPDVDRKIQSTPTTPEKRTNPFPDSLNPRRINLYHRKYQDDGRSIIRKSPYFSKENLKKKYSSGKKWGSKNPQIRVIPKTKRLDLSSL